jgi:hypothetical protein
MLCPGCGSKYLEGAKFCGSCGYNLVSGERTCPACKEVILPGNKFCTNCGARIQENAATGGEPEKGEEKAELTLDQIRDMAAGFRYNALSPLSGFRDPEKKGETGKIRLDKDLLEAVLTPERAFYVTGMSTEKSFQKILLIKESECYLWTDEGGRAVISKGENPKNYFETLFNEIGRGITKDNQHVVVLRQGEIEVLKAIDAFCESLELIHVTPVFATKVQIERFLNGGQELEPFLKGLSEKGLIKLLGLENTVIKLEEKGREIAKALTDYDYFYSLVILTEGSEEYPSINLSSSRGQLYMFTNPKDGEDIVIRSIHSEGLRSLLHWAWASGLSMDSRVAGSQS